MVEKVIVKSASSDLDGAQFDNAATEATLKRLVELMEKQKPGSGAAVNNAAQKANGLSSTGMKETNKAIDDLGNFAKSASEGVGSFAAQTVKFLASGAMSLLGSGLIFLKDSIGQSVDTLRNTAKSGASFNGSLLELNRSAAMSGMNLEKYSEFIGKNKETMAMFGGTVTEGAKRMGEMAKDLRNSPVGEQLQALGVSADDISNGMAQYVSQQSAAGKLQGKSQGELTKGAGEYLKSLGELSRLTGESVEALAAKQNEEQREARVAIATAGMSDEAKKMMTDSMVFAAASNKDFANSFKNSFSGIPDETAEFMMANNKAYADAVRKVQRGESVSREEMAAAMAGNADLFDELGKSTGKAAMANTASIMGLAKMQGDMSDMRNKVAAGGLKAAADEGKKSEAFTKSVMTFDNTVNSIIGQIKVAILDSGIFKILADAVDWVSKKFLEFKPTLMEFFNNISSYIKPAMDTLGSAVSIAAGIFQTLLMPIAKQLWSDLSGLATGIYQFVKPAFDAIGAAFNFFSPTINKTSESMKPIAGLLTLFAEGLLIAKGVQLASIAIQNAYNAAKVIGTASILGMSLPMIGIVAAIVSVIAIFKALYDSGWSLSTAWEAIKDNFSLVMLKMSKSISDTIDWIVSKTSFGIGGKSDAEKKADEAKYQAQLAEYAAREKARDEKREATRKERGTEDSLLNLSGKSATPSVPQPPTAAAVASGQSLANTTPNINALVNQIKPGDDVSNATNAMAEFLAANPKFAVAQEATANQTATLNTMNDGMTKLTTIMASILELQHQQVDAQKDLVNATKGKYNAVG